MRNAGTKQVRTGISIYTITEPLLIKVQVSNLKANNTLSNLNFNNISESSTCCTECSLAFGCHQPLNQSPRAASRSGPGRVSDGSNWLECSQGAQYYRSTTRVTPTVCGHLANMYRALAYPYAVAQLWRPAASQSQPLAPNVNNCRIACGKTD